MIPARISFRIEPTFTLWPTYNVRMPRPNLFLEAQRPAWKTERAACERFSHLAAVEGRPPGQLFIELLVAEEARLAAQLGSAVVGSAAAISSVALPPAPQHSQAFPGVRQAIRPSAREGLRTSEVLT